MLDINKLPYVYQDMIESIKNNEVKFKDDDTIYNCNTQIELLRLARQIRSYKGQSYQRKIKAHTIYHVTIRVVQNGIFITTIEQMLFNKYELDVILKVFPNSTYREIEVE